MTFQNKKVLITGGAGFIGSNLALQLVNTKANITLLDSFLPNLGGNKQNLVGLENKVQLHKRDLRELAHDPKLVKDFDFIFNLAGNISHIDSMNDPLFDNAINTEAQICLLEACRKVNPNAVIVFSSTRQIYGAPQYLPVDEKHPIAPVDVNGINKLAAEYYHQLYAKVYGLNTICLRLTNTYGPRQLIRHARQGFIGWFLNRAITGNTIDLYGGGEQVRDFTFVDDVCDAMMTTALNPSCYKDVFNVNGQRSSVKEIAEILLEECGQGKLNIIPFPEEKKKIDIGNYYCTAEKLESISPWKVKTPLREGIGKMVNYYKEAYSYYL